VRHVSLVRYSFEKRARGEKLLLSSKNVSM
jgi:hypothetical protein